MFEVGFVERVAFVPLRAAAFLAGALFRALFDRGAFLTAAAFDVLFAVLFTGTGCRDVSAEGAATWVRLAGPAETSAARAERLAGTVFVAALLAGDFLVPGLAAGPLRDPAGLAVWPRAASGVVATAAGADCVVLDPKAAWTVANASSNESWRVSTVTFMRCSWAGESGDVRSQCPTRGRRCSLDFSAAGQCERALCGITPAWDRRPGIGAVWVQVHTRRYDAHPSCERCWPRGFLVLRAEPLQAAPGPYRVDTVTRHCHSHILFGEEPREVSSVSVELPPDRDFGDTP